MWFKMEERCAGEVRVEDYGMLSNWFDERRNGN